MTRIDKVKGVPIYHWGDLTEGTTIKQIHNLAQHLKAFHHVALMPDGHAGEGMPIGGVFAAKDYIIPAAVGVDIGCGMLAVETDLEIDSSPASRERAKDFIDYLSYLVPVGYKHRKNIVRSSLFDKDRIPKAKVVRDEIQSAGYQLGTLGGGNHFIEVQISQDNKLWVMVHTGSRNIGYRIGNHYIRLAKAETAKMFENRPPANLGGFHTESPIGMEYIESMQYAVAFAQKNRMEIYKHICTGLRSVYPDVNTTRSIEIAHNYAIQEKHFGELVWVHRKGATLASKGTAGIIPGSMSTSSYIVRGKGNPDSFNSCSHGAGRLCGRREFTRNHTLEECEKELGDIYLKGGWRADGGKDLSEAGAAYKDILTVMEAQTDLIDIVHTLKPLAVLKG